MRTPKPHALFDEVIHKNRLRSDAGLCRFLGLQAALVSRIRSGALPMNDMVRVKVMRICKWSLKRVDELCSLD